MKKRIAFDVLLRKFIPYLSILFLGAILLSGVFFKYVSDISLAKERFRQEEHFKAANVTVNINYSFRRIYEGLRTISRLPSVKNIDRYGKTISADDRKVIQEIYNNIAADVSLSEVYIVPLSFNPDRLDPNTEKLESPILMFDELITGKFSLSDAASHGTPQAFQLEEVEIYEYKLLQKQLKWFFENFATEDYIKGLEVPAILGPEVITCDNSFFNPFKPNDKDRSGLVYSIPFYDNDQKLKGSVSGIFLTHILKKLLPTGNYAIRNSKYDYTIYPVENVESFYSKQFVQAKQLNPNLIYSEVIPLTINEEGHDWVLWAGISNEEFWLRPNVITIEHFFKFASGAVVFLVILLILGFIFLERYIKKAMQIKEALEFSKALESKNAQLDKEIDQRKLAEEELKKSYEELKQTQGRLFQSEKLASIGQLAAGVAHEINNPLGFISSNMEILREYVGNYVRILKVIQGVKANIDVGDVEKARINMDELKKLEAEINLDFMSNDINKLLEHSIRGLERIRKIVLDLRIFSSNENAERKDFFKVNEAIDSILSIVQSDLRNKAELVLEYGDVPLIAGNAQRLGQVFINLLVNAAQAMEDKGKIVIKTYRLDNFVCVDIIDTGKGISEENIKRIFDPFFTTKPVGQGTGLGLSISHEIVKKHGGQITVRSKVGEGTTFTVMLPVS